MAPLKIQDDPPAPPTIITNSAVKSVDTTVAVGKLWDAFKVCFVTASATFVQQHSYNNKAQKMAEFSATSQLNQHADKTLEILARDGGPTGKVATFAHDAVQQCANAAAKCKLQSDSAYP
jgi:hypothetical protein